MCVQSFMGKSESCLLSVSLSSHALVRFFLVLNSTPYLLYFSVIVSTCLSSLVLNFGIVKSVIKDRCMVSGIYLIAV